MSRRRGHDADIETLAAYAAVIRHELGLSPRDDALAALQARLDPGDPGERPPARAPAVVRLRATLGALLARRAPDASLDELTHDLRFLRVFEPEPFEREALDRLMADVTKPRPRRARKVVPFRPPAEDA
jgi:hypothetical protein